MNEKIMCIIYILNELYSSVKIKFVALLGKLMELVIIVLSNTMQANTLSFPSYMEPGYECILSNIIQANILSVLSYMEPGSECIHMHAYSLMCVCDMKGKRGLKGEVNTRKKLDIYVIKTEKGLFGKRGRNIKKGRVCGERIRKCNETNAWNYHSEICFLVC